jgi:acetyl-CoA C-acetyltransferase
MSCFVLGGAHSDFARHLAREGVELADLTGELVDAVLADAAIEASELETIHVGNAFGQLFTGQGHLGAMPASVRPALWGVPAARHEAACASGSIAMLAAAAELDAGRYDCALVLGLEQERNVPGPVAAQHLAAAAWVGHEGERAAAAKYLWPHQFARVGELYAERWGLERAHLKALSQQAFANAKKNPVAQTRGWSAQAEDPVVDGCLHRSDCAQVTDGGAAVVLASAKFAAAWAGKRGRRLEDVPRLLGWGHRTVGLSLDSKLERARPGELLFPHVAQAMNDARRRAGASELDGGGLSRAGSTAEGQCGSIDGYEVHDCFTTTMYLAIDHLGLTAPGRAFEAIEDGRVAKINPGGGLIGIGHPVGATGVRMVVDAARQVAGRAGETQLPGAKRIGTLNLGGSTSTVVAFVVGV